MKLWSTLSLIFIAVFAYANTSDTDYGRLNVTWPDLGHDGGALLHQKITDGIEKISDNIAGRYSGDLSLPASGTVDFTHGLGIPLADLRVYIFNAGSQITELVFDADYTLTQVDTNTIRVGDTSGVAKTIQVLVLPYRLDVRIEDIGVEHRPTTGNGLFVLRDSTDTLTNKVYDGGTASATNKLLIPQDTLSNLTALVRDESAIYYDTDSQSLYLDDGVSLIQVGSGAGGGGKNYLDNPDFKNNLNDWTQYYDGNVGEPVDGTGASTANLTFSRTTTAADVLEGEASGELTIPVSTSGRGNGIRSDFTIDRQYQSKQLSVSFFYDTSDFPSYGEGNWIACIYQVDGTPGLVQLSGPIPNASGDCQRLPVGEPAQFKGNFVSQATGTDYRILIHMADGLAPATVRTIQVDDFKVAPVEFGQLDVVSDFETAVSEIEASGTNPSKGTTSDDIMRYRRVGNVMELFWNYDQSAGGSGGTGDYLIKIPEDLTADTTFISTLNSSTLNTVGQGKVFSTAGQSVGEVYVNGSTPNFLKIKFTTSTASTLEVEDWSQSNHPFSDADLRVSITARIPIAEWASTEGLTTLGPAIEYASNSAGDTDADDSSSFVSGPDGALVPRAALTGDRYRDVQFTTSIAPTDKIYLEVQTDAGTGWHELNGSLRANGSNVIDTYLRRSGGSFGYGIGGLEQLDDKTVRVYFGQYRQQGSTYNGAGGNWSSLSGDDIRWRVVKEKGIAPVALAEATDENAGFIYKSRWTKRIQGSDITATTTNIAGLRLENLVSGRQYMLILDCRMNATTGSIGQFTAIHDASTLTQCQVNPQGGTESTRWGQTAFFTATSDFVQFNFSETGTSSFQTNSSVTLVEIRDSENESNAFVP